MNAFAAIRDRLKVSQKEMADALGVSQGNVSFYEVKDQTVPPKVAKRLIAFARERGQAVSFEDIYGDPEPSPRKRARKTA